MKTKKYSGYFGKIEEIGPYCPATAQRVKTEKKNLFNYRLTVYKIGMAALDYILRHSANCKRATKSHSYSILNPWLDCSGRGFAAEFFGGF